jgi:hypothetical protein
MIKMNEDVGRITGKFFDASASGQPQSNFITDRIISDLSHYHFCSPNIVVPPLYHKDILEIQSSDEQQTIEEKHSFQSLSLFNVQSFISLAMIQGIFFARFLPEQGMFFLCSGGSTLASTTPPVLILKKLWIFFRGDLLKIPSTPASVQ